jgi:hypothetical protein
MSKAKQTPLSRKQKAMIKWKRWHPPVYLLPAACEAGHHVNHARYRTCADGDLKP